MQSTSLVLEETLKHYRTKQELQLTEAVHETIHNLSSQNFIAVAILFQNLYKEAEALFFKIDNSEEMNHNQVTSLEIDTNFEVLKPIEA